MVTVTTERGEEQWPNEMVDLQDDRLVIFDPLYGNRIVTYPYVSSRRLDNGGWEFIGPEDDFTVAAGPAQPPSMDTDEPWPPVSDLSD